MNERSLAISILQQARDALHARLAERIVESRDEILADAEGGAYLSEIELLYEQLGARLAHINSMLSNLPPAESDATAAAEVAEVIYADFAAACTTRLDQDPPGASAGLLGLPAPLPAEEQPATPAAELRRLAVLVRLGELSAAARLIGELLDIQPSLARQAVGAFASRTATIPDLGRRLEDLGGALASSSEYAVAALLGECFDFQVLDALSLARALKAAASGEAPH